MLDARYLLLHQALGLGKMWLQKGACLTSPEMQEKPDIKQEKPLVFTAEKNQEEPTVVAVDMSVIKKPSVIHSVVLVSLAQECMQCQSCTLSTCCKKPIFGGGNAEAELLIFSTCPTPEDDLSGQLFYGETGQFLAKMLAAINIDIESVYLTTAVKCASGFKIEIGPEYYQSCMPFFARQIELVNPKAILALGSDLECWGRPNENGLSYQNIPYFVIPHPARLLRHPKEKRLAWEILQKLEKFLLSS